MATNQLPVACFAPPLDDTKLSRYKALVDAGDVATPEQREAMHTLLRCVEAWWEAPESNRKDGRRLQIKSPVFDDNGNLELDDKGAPVREDVIVQEVPFTDDIIKSLDATTPWMRELNTLSTPAADGLLDSLPPGELRDAAFHLLWHAKEITLDREPTTQAMLPQSVQKGIARMNQLKAGK